MRLLRNRTTQTELDDDLLVQRCRAGSNDAFGTLYDRHLPGLYAYAYRLLGNQSDAEDAAHDAFTRAWSSLHQYRDGNFRGWLFSILHNLCIDRQRQKGPGESVYDEQFQLASPGSVESQAIDLATIDQITALLAHFPESQRAVVAMKMSGLRYREIATALGKSEDAVAQDYSRAIKRLAQAMEGRPVPATAGEGGWS